MLSLVRVLGSILICIHFSHSILANGEGQCALGSRRVTQTSPSLGAPAERLAEAMAYVILGMHTQLLLNRATHRLHIRSYVNT